jgi:CheY-like chemotaxis protein
MQSKTQVLIICHTAAGKMYLGVILKRIWYDPVLAGTAEEGIRLAQKDRFSLVVLDGDLAEPDLKKAVTLLRSDPSVKDLPLVLFVTGENPGTNEDLLAQGCAAVFSKPLDLAIVYGVLGRLTGGQRQTARIPVKFRVKIDEGIPGRELICINLSESGMYLRTHEILPENTVIHVRFTLPHDSFVIEAVAEVVRTEPLGTHIESEPGIGLRFLDISEDAKLRVRNFVQWELMGDLEWKPLI